ncbi:Cytochrome oxidase assembly protein 1 [Diplodia seriata]|uniref:Cytochrome oxidase assembly protein 1 n=1 Tax=Diplodia seriata TaxID=420778 RepID=A0A1S8B7V5_9PEZI|nr:Cytochrome oxidase assembly protein 1 [Diplodia seriata]
MTRRADRALPSVRNPSSLRWAISLPFFGAIIAGATLAIFNYQKQSSSVVESTLYALRTHPEAREHLGGEIQFASSMPWISGTIDQLHGRIDVSYGVKGRNGRGVMRFRSERRKRMGYVSFYFSIFFFFSSLHRLVLRDLGKRAGAGAGVGGFGGWRIEKAGELVAAE